MFGQGLPVEFHAVTRSVRGDGFAVFDSKGMGDKPFKAESVHFQVISVGCCRQQVDV